MLSCHSFVELEKGYSHGYFDTAARCADSQCHTRARNPSRSPHDDNCRNFASLRARTLPPIQNAIPSPASQDVFQGVPPAPNAPIRPSFLSSTPLDQSSSRSVSVQGLLNPAGGHFSDIQTCRRTAERFDSPPRLASIGSTSRRATPSMPTASMTSRSPIDVSLPSVTPSLIGVYPPPAGRSMTPSSPSNHAPSGTIHNRQSLFVLPRDHVNANNAPGSLSLSEMTTGLPVSSRSHAPSLPQARSSPCRQLSQGAPYSQGQYCGRPRGDNPAPPQPASQSDSLSTQCSSYSQVSRTEPAITPPIASTGQPRHFLPSPSSGPASTMPQMPQSAMVFEVPTSSTAAQSQYQMMLLETEQGPIQVPIDVQAASKVADEKRERNATASHRFRQRRKQRERETAEKIAKWEAQVWETSEDKEHYLKERDYFRDLALRYRIPIIPRPLSPRHGRHATQGRASLARYQEAEGSGQTGLYTSSFVPSQSLLSSAVELPPPMRP